MNQTPLQIAMDQAAALMRARKDADAVEILRKALLRKPGDIAGLLLLTRAQTRAGQHEAAQFTLDRLRACKVAGRDLIEMLDAQGALEIARKQQGKAIEVYRQLLSINPQVPRAYESLAGAQLYLDDFEGATATFERGVAACRTDSNIWHVYLMMNLMQGFSGKALEVIRRGLEAVPDHPDLRADLCHVLNYIPNVPLGEIADAHRQFGRVAMSYIKTTPAPHTNTPDPERTLRVGFVSGDFKLHSCAYFFEPLLENLDRARVEPIMYHRDERYDDTTRRLASKGRLEHVASLSYKELAQKLRDDALDIAIDLSGHMAGNGLYALIRKPAPVQATWLGYPNTTGLPTIDYRIVDEWTDPPSDSATRIGLPADWPGADAFAHEKLVRLPRCFLCYRPPEQAPDVEPPPSVKHNRPVTFTSFNALQKINPRLIELWAKVLIAAPQTRLLLKGSYLVSLTERTYRAEFAKHGVDPSRLEFRKMTPNPRDHFEVYHQADIALDAFPYHGTTTTCEAMHMGLPVVSRIGPGHASRVGLSLLNAVGLPEFACGSDEAFVQTAVDLARDPAKLTSLRAGMRQRLASSPLGDGPGFARAFEQALRQMWRTWCASRHGSNSGAS